MQINFITWRYDCFHQIPLFSLWFSSLFFSFLHELAEMSFLFCFIRNENFILYVDSARSSLRCERKNLPCMVRLGLGVVLGWALGGGGCTPTLCRSCPDIHFYLLWHKPFRPFRPPDGNANFQEKLWIHETKSYSIENFDSEKAWRTQHSTCLN